MFFNQLKILFPILLIKIQIVIPEIYQIIRNLHLSKYRFIRLRFLNVLFILSFSIVNLFAQSSSNFKLIKLADGVFTAINRPGGHAISNAGIIDLGDKTVIFDPFLSLEATQELIDAAIELDLSPIAYVVNSHWHNDHVRGNQAFDEDVQIISTKMAREMIIKNEVATIASEKAIAPKQIIRYDTLIQNHFTQTGLEYEDYILWKAYYQAILESHTSFDIRYPDLTFTDKMELSGPKRRIQLLSLGEGHTEGDLVLYLPEERILFAGDLIINGMHPFISDGDPDLWLDVLKEFNQLEISKIIPGHGSVGDRGHLIKMTSYLEDLLTIRDTLNREEDLSKIPIPLDFQGWHFPEFFRANLAHLASQNLESNQSFQEVGEIENDNGIIHYKVRGRGIPILLLSSGPGYSGEYLSPVVNTLGRNDKIILPDLRGTGRSAVTKYNAETINLKTIIKDLDSLRKHLDLDNWIVMGHGFGGMVAMEYAAQYPNQTQALILTNSGGTDLKFMRYFADSYERNLGRANLDSLWYWENDIRKAKFPEKSWRMHFKIEQAAYLFDPLQVDRLTKYFSREEFSQEMSDLLWNDLATNYNPEASLTSFTAPVLLIGGRQDPMDAATLYQIREVLPQAEIEIIERCGHYPWIEQPRTFYKTITDFLNRID